MHTPTVARDADLFIFECCFYQKPVRFHLNDPTIKGRRTKLQAKRLMLTHPGPEMLKHKHIIPDECAYEGLGTSI